MSRRDDAPFGASIVVALAEADAGSLVTGETHRFVRQEKSVRVANSCYGKR